MKKKLNSLREKYVNEIVKFEYSLKYLHLFLFLRFKEIGIKFSLIKDLEKFDFSNEKNNIKQKLFNAINKTINKYIYEFHDDFDNFPLNVISLEKIIRKMRSSNQSNRILNRLLNEIIKNDSILEETLVKEEKRVLKNFSEKNNKKLWESIEEIRKWRNYLFHDYLEKKDKSLIDNYLKVDLKVINAIFYEKHNLHSVYKLIVELIMEEKHSIICQSFNEKNKKVK